MRFEQVPRGDVHSEHAPVTGVPAGEWSCAVQPASHSEESVQALPASFVGKLQTSRAFIPRFSHLPPCASQDARSRAPRVGVAAGTTALDAGSTPNSLSSLRAFSCSERVSGA